MLAPHGHGSSSIDTETLAAGGRSGDDFDGMPARPSAGQLPEMAIMAAVFADDMHGPRGALALAAGVRQFCPPLRANMVRERDPPSAGGGLRIRFCDSMPLVCSVHPS